MGKFSRSQDGVEMRDDVTGTVFHRSLTFMHVLKPEALTAFLLDYLSKDICVENNLARQIWYLSGAMDRFVYCPV